jgi:predicted NBD/HSP70 family sugar kinase
MTAGLTALRDTVSRATPSRAGRGDRPVVLGVDVGGTKTAAILVDAVDDVVLATSVVPTRRDALVRSIGQLGRELLAEAGLEPTRLAAVGVGLPGSVDAAAGTVALAVNVDAREQPIAASVAADLGAPCFIEHDARAAARRLAVLDAGAHRALGFVSIGTGVSAGVVVDGQPMAGALGIAGEIGHVVADPDGPPCVCGLRGCLEAVASGPAIERQGRQAAVARRADSVLSPDCRTVDVFAAAATGDVAARAIVGAAAAHLARGIRGLALTFGLDLVIVGGGVARAGDALMGPLLEAIGRERSAAPIVAALLADGVVRARTADPDLGAWGAVTVARAGLASAPNTTEPSSPAGADHGREEVKDAT